MTKLSVNVNKVATLRNTRAIGSTPSVHSCREDRAGGGGGGDYGASAAGSAAYSAGGCVRVGGIAEGLSGAAEYNIEGNPFYEFVQYAERVHPTQCTLVPDSLEASTSDHGWDLVRDGKRLRPVIEQLKSLGCRVAIFMDANPKSMDLAAELGVDRVELYTAPYAEDFAAGNANAAEAYAIAARRAGERGLGVNAGHDLSLKNLRAFVQTVPNVLEVSIGHALIGDALEFGLAETVRKYLAAIRI